MNAVPRQRPHRGRRNYQFRTELSGLERPRQWIGVFVTAIATILVIGLISAILA